MGLRRWFNIDRLRQEAPWRVENGVEINQTRLLRQGSSFPIPSLIERIVPQALIEIFLEERGYLILSSSRAVLPTGLVVLARAGRSLLNVTFSYRMELPRFEGPPSDSGDLFFV